MEGRDRRHRRDLIGLAAVVAASALAWEGGLAWQAHRDAARLSAVARPGDIRMISSLTCVFCAQARSWMSGHGIPFEECLIERDARCEADYRALLGPGTPLLIVAGEAQLGFRPGRVAQRLEQARGRPDAPAH